MDQFENGDPALVTQKWCMEGKGQNGEISRWLREQSIPLRSSLQRLITTKQ